MIQPPMSWARCWRIIRYIQTNGLPKTPGTLAYLNQEILRMDRYQRARFDQECAGILQESVSCAC
jgi:hypothetical protein